MKNYLIKSFIIISSMMLLSQVNADIIWPDISVKYSSSADETYTSTLNWISNQDTILNFEIVWVFDDNNNQRDYSIVLPNWFEYITYSTDWTTCTTQTINNSTNNSFTYTVSPNATCTSKIVLTYKVTSSTTAWNHNISVLNTTSWTNISSVNLWITATYSIINAETQDTDSDWYIDTYKLVFNWILSDTFSNDGLTIWTLTPTEVSKSWNTAYLSIDDSTYKTGEKPKINDTDWGMYNNIWIITDVTPTDKAAPILETVNWQDISNDVTITADWDLTLKFSEFLLPSANVEISLKDSNWNPVNSINTFWELDTLTINPDSSLSAWSYSITSTSEAKDWSSNANVLNIEVNTLIVTDTEAPVWQAIWSSTWISINSWNSKTNNTSVQLDVLATDNVWVTKMCISNTDLDLEEASPNHTCPNWLDYSTGKFNHTIIWDSWEENTVYIWFKDNNWNISQYSDSIYYEDSNSYIMFDNLDSVYTNQDTITLNWTCNHYHIDPSQVKTWLKFTDWTTTTAGTCWVDWKFSYTYNVSEWENTFEAYYTEIDTIKSTIKIYKDTTAPTLSITPTTTNSNSSITVAISSDDIYDIYYTTDWTAASASSTKYTWSFNLNSNTTVNYYSIDSAWNETSWSKSYTFTCATSTVTKWSVAAYPGCEITCNDWYELDWSTCSLIYVAPVSSWGWGWSSAPRDYEWLDTLSNKVIDIEEVVESSIKKDWTLNLENLEWNKITWDNAYIELRSNYRAESVMLINPDTSIEVDWEWDKTITPLHSISMISDLGLRELTVWNMILRSVYIKSLFFAWNEEATVWFDKNINLSFNLKDEDSNYYIFKSDSLEWNFSLINSEAITTDSDWLLHLQTNELSYFVFVKQRYFDRFYWDSSGLIESWMSIDETIDYLNNNVVSSKVSALIDKVWNKLKIEDIEFYTSFDKDLNNEYQKTINWYNDFLINVDKYLVSKDKADLQKAKDWYIAYLKYKDLNNFENKYITEEWGIYKTKYTKLVKPLVTVEKIIIKKLKSLRDSETINLSTYNNAISDYNDFVLYLSIFQEYDKNKDAGKRWLEAVTNLMKVYNLKVINKVSQTTLIKDKYTFSSDLKLRDYNSDVTNLQLIMKSYWYFDYEATGYFWTATESSLIRFSTDILNIPNSSWIFNSLKREKIWELELK